jgi:hypothetical protein
LIMSSSHRLLIIHSPQDKNSHIIRKLQLE